LGGQNVKRLETEGKDGRETARVAAATAPQTAGAQAPGGSSGSGADSSPHGGGGGNDSGIPPTDGGAGEGAPSNVAGAGSAGSGVGSVAGQATGLNTSEGTGLLLPLVLIAIVAWGSAYVLRRRKRAAQ